MNKTNIIISLTGGINIFFAAAAAAAFNDEYFLQDFYICHPLSLLLFSMMIIIIGWMIFECFFFSPSPNIRSSLSTRKFGCNKIECNQIKSKKNHKNSEIYDKLNFMNQITLNKGQESSSSSSFWVLKWASNSRKNS